LSAYLVSLNGLSAVGLNASHGADGNQHTPPLAWVGEEMTPFASLCLFSFGGGVDGDLEVFLLQKRGPIWLSWRRARTLTSSCLSLESTDCVSFLLFVQVKFAIRSPMGKELDL